MLESYNFVSSALVDFQTPEEETEVHTVISHFETIIKESNRCVCNWVHNGKNFDIQQYYGMVIGWMKKTMKFYKYKGALQRFYSVRPFITFDKNYQITSVKFITYSYSGELVGRLEWLNKILNDLNYEELRWQGSEEGLSSDPSIMLKEINFNSISNFKFQ